MSKVSGNYASGIAMPFRPDSDGGIVLTEGDRYITNLVLATVAPNESDNPFQDLGDEAPIFQNPDSNSWQVRWRRRIKSQMALLERENLARLLDVSFSKGGEGEYNVTVTFINLETARRQDVSAGITRTADGGLGVQGIP